MTQCVGKFARQALIACMTLVAIGRGASVLAGGGPEGVLLVVNPLSSSSVTIANHYIALREIPADNVLYVPWTPNNKTTDIDTFRRQILLPVLRSIQKRRLTGQIDYVVYSSDFPTRINLKSDVRTFTEAMRPKPAPETDGKEKPDSEQAAKPVWPAVLSPVGSANGLTYLWQPVMAKTPEYFELRTNRYARRSVAGQGGATSAGFRGSQQYGSQGEAVASGGRGYLLSTMLGVTGEGGNSLDEVIRYLRRSAAADGTHPRGTVYFVKNSDVRSRARDGLFPTAVRELMTLGVAAEVIEGTVPLNKPDVQGVVMGTAVFDWKVSGSTILPGAVCENFTSFGGVLKTNNKQTTLAEFLRYGAAGSSGTVTEPYAIPSKFPSPLIQVHYARGCTLAEAFYQSVEGPYQLLIVGDPLCRPWADIPNVSVTGVESGTVVNGSLALKPAATVMGEKPVDVFELFVDGRRMAACNAGGTLALDTTKLADGYHDLRVVAVGPVPIESQGRHLISVELRNHDRTITASLATEGPLRSAMPLQIDVKSPGSIGVLAVQGTRIVGRVVGPEGQIEIPPNTLGTGPVRLRVVGLGEGGMQASVMAKPLEFSLE